MANVLFIILTSLCTLALIYWGCTRLPQEKWQILAAVPVKKDEKGNWQGINITYYGFFTANAYLAGALFFIFLSAAFSIPLASVLLLTLIVLAFCIPASAVIARLIEKKASVFTVAGGFFTGMAVLPPAALLLNAFHKESGGGVLSVMALLAAAGIAYSYAAGIGTLACMSFGCCYGKPVTSSVPVLQKLFKKCSFTFCGSTKKIAYAHGLDATPVFPVQGVTALLYTAAALFGAIFFLNGFFRSAFLITVIATQTWRFVSEFLRADYRGTGKISAYQKMAIISICYALFLAVLPSTQPVAPADITAGLLVVVKPEVLFLMLCLWLGTFYITGRSRVTGSSITFYVNKDSI